MTEKSSPTRAKNPPPLEGGGQGEGSLIRHAKRMRLNPTRPERILWYALRNRALEGLKFRRQAPIGHHIADFFCAQARDAWLRNRGYVVLRFWNNEIMGNLPGVLELIRLSAAHVHTPPPDPLPQGEGDS